MHPGRVSPLPPMRRKPLVDQGLLIDEASRLHTHTHTHTHTYTPHFGRNPLDEWSIRRRDLYLTTHNTHKTQPCPRRDSNLQSQQASGRRPTPQTARPLWSAMDEFYCKLSATNMAKWVNLLAYFLCCVSIHRHYIVLFYIPLHSFPYVILCSSYTHLFSGFLVTLQLFFTPFVGVGDLLLLQEI